MAFADRLKKLREDNKMTQSDLAERLGVTQRTISYYETGKGIPSDPDMLNGLVKIFGISLDFLLLDEEKLGSKLHALVKKLQNDTNNYALKWVQFSTAGFYSDPDFDHPMSFNGRHFIHHHEDFNIEDYSQYNYTSINLNKSFYTDYKSGGYLVAYLSSEVGSMVLALFALYKNKFHLIADMNAIKQIEELYLSIRSTQSGIGEFINEYLNDDLEKESDTPFHGSEIFPDKDVPF